MVFLKTTPEKLHPLVVAFSRWIRAGQVYVHQVRGSEVGVAKIGAVQLRVGEHRGRERGIGANVALVRSDPLKVTCEQLAPLKSHPNNSELLKLALVSIALLRLALISATPLRIRAREVLAGARILVLNLPHQQSLR